MSLKSCATKFGIRSCAIQKEALDRSVNTTPTTKF